MPAGVRGGGASRVDAAGGERVRLRRRRLGRRRRARRGFARWRRATRAWWDRRRRAPPQSRAGFCRARRGAPHPRSRRSRGERARRRRGRRRRGGRAARCGRGSARCGDVRSIATRGESAGRARALPVLLVLLQRVIHVVVGKAHARARPAGDVGPERRAPAVGVHARGVRRVARAGKGRIEQQRADAKPGRVFPHPRRRLEEPDPRLLRTKRVSHDLERVRREELRQNAGRLETGGAREGTPPGHPPRPAWPRAARAQRVPDRLCDPRELTRPKIVRASSHRYRIRRGAVGCALDGKTPAGKLLTTGAREVAFSHPPPTCLTRTPPFLITPCPLDRLRRATAPCASP